MITADDGVVVQAGDAKPSDEGVTGGIRRRLPIENVVVKNYSVFPPFKSILASEAGMRYGGDP
jgi:hypothetical protein